MQTKFESRHAMGSLVEVRSDKAETIMGVITEVIFATNNNYCYTIQCCNTKDILRGIGPNQIGKVYAVDRGAPPAPAQELPV